MRALQIPLDHTQPNPWQTRQGYDWDHIRKIAFSVLRHGLQQLPAGRLVDDDGAPIDVGDHILTDQTEIDELVSDGTPAVFVQLAYGHNRKRALALIRDWIEEGERPARPEEDGPQPIERGDLPDQVSVGYVPMRLQQFSDEEMADLAWTENEDRQELSPLEEAKAIKDRMVDFGLTQTDVAERLGMARSTVSNKLRLLKLPDDVVEKVEDEGLSERAANALLPYTELSEEQQEALSSYQLSRVLEKVDENPSDVTSQEVREAVSSAFDFQARISEEGFDADHDLVGDPRFDIDYENDDLEAGACSNCDLAIERDGDVLCPKSKCLHAKRRAWRGHAAEEGASELGLDVVSGLEWGEYYSFDDESRMASHDHDEEAVENALENGCENLALYNDGNHSRYMSPDGVPARFVCHHGKDGTCECLGQLKQEAQEEIQEEKTRDKERIERLQEHVQEQLRPLFEDVPTAVLGFEMSRARVREALDEETGQLSREMLVDSHLSSLISSINFTIPYEEDDEYGPWVEAIEEYLEALGIEHVEVRDPEAPPSIDKLRALYSRTEGMQHEEQRRRCKELKAEIGRRQAYLQKYEPESSELEDLADLHSTVAEAAKGPNGVPSDSAPEEEETEKEAPTPAVGTTHPQAVAPESAEEEATGDSAGTEQDEQASIGLNAATVRFLVEEDAVDDLLMEAPLSALMVAHWCSEGERNATIGQAIHRRSGKSNVSLLYTSFRKPLQEKMQEVKGRIEQDQKVTAP